MAIRKLRLRIGDRGRDVGGLRCVDPRRRDKPGGKMRHANARSSGTPGPLYRYTSILKSAVSIIPEP
jgi:hypothetical protein